MALLEDLSKRQSIPTTPDSTEVVRRGRVAETIKDVFVWELRQLMSTTGPDRLDAVPSIDKYQADIPGAGRDLDPLETVVRVVRQYSDITEKLPLVTVGLGAIKNKKMGISGKFVDTIFPRPCLVSGQGTFAPGLPGIVIPPAPGVYPDAASPTAPPYSATPTGTADLFVVGADFVEITTTIDGVAFIEVLTFTSTLLGVAPQTPRDIADIINYQALYCHASVVLVGGIPKLIVEAGGPALTGKKYSIQRTNASANFDAWINFPIGAAIAPSDAFPAMNRYMISLDAEVSLFVLSEGENIRTELVDILLDFFTFVMDDRNFTFYGRSIFGDQTDETYQIILKDGEVATAGEQEVPRQDDPTRKIYINRISIPVSVFQYIDRVVAQGVVAKQG